MRWCSISCPRKPWTVWALLTFLCCLFVTSIALISSAVSQRTATNCWLQNVQNFLSYCRCLLISESAFLQFSAPFARTFLFITIHNITTLISIASFSELSVFMLILFALQKQKSKKNTSLLKTENKNAFTFLTLQDNPTCELEEGKDPMHCACANSFKYVVFVQSA